MMFLNRLVPFVNFRGLNQLGLFWICAFKLPIPDIGTVHISETRLEDFHKLWLTNVISWFH